MEHDNTLIKQAIDNYSHFSPNQKEVLNILIDMAVDGQVVANINDICAISTSTRATVSTAISFLNKYELIIDCDPSNLITNRYFSKKIIKKYNSYAYTTIITHDQVLNEAAFQIFTKKGPLAFLPISNRETSIVYSVHNSNNQKEENIEQLIKDKNFKYRITNIEKINKFELKSLNLRSYYHSNILAFGDLLHKVHPLVGQGFNMTIRDIKILLKIIKRKCDLGLSLDSSVNTEFEDNLKHKNFIFSKTIV